MPDQIPINFEQSALEGDMARLAAEVQTHKERPETSNLNDQQVLKLALQSMAATHVPDDTPAPTTSTSSTSLPNYLKDASAETKLEVEYLIDLALRQGIDKAHEQAKKANAFIIDAFHDTLTGKLYPEFKKRGLLK